MRAIVDVIPQQCVMCRRMFEREREKKNAEREMDNCATLLLISWLRIVKQFSCRNLCPLFFPFLSLFLSLSPSLSLIVSSTLVEYLYEAIEIDAFFHRYFYYLIKFVYLVLPIVEFPLYQEIQMLQSSLRFYAKCPASMEWFCFIWLISRYYLLKYQLVNNFSSNRCHQYSTIVWGQFMRYIRRSIVTSIHK